MFIAALIVEVHACAPLWRLCVRTYTYTSPRQPKANASQQRSGINDSAFPQGSQSRGLRVNYGLKEVFTSSAGEGRQLWMIESPFPLVLNQQLGFQSRTWRSDHAGQWHPLLAGLRSCPCRIKEGTPTKEDHRGGSYGYPLSVTPTVAF